MNKIIINEQQYNKLILEYGGNIHGLDNLISFIAYKSRQYAFKTIIPNYTKNIATSKESIVEPEDVVEHLYQDNQQEIKNNGIYMLPYNYQISEDELNYLGIYNITDINIQFILSYNAVGLFASNEVKRLKNGKYSNIHIYIELFNLLFNNANDLELVLKHELTHMYQLLRTSSKSGSLKKARTNWNNIFYVPNRKNFINSCSYFFSNVEQGAMLNELYEMLKQHNATRYNYKFILFENNSYTAFLNMMKKLIEYCENNISVVYDIFELAEMNNELLDGFPSIKGYTVQRYHKRLLNALKSNLERFHRKTRQIINTYLMDTLK